MPIVEGNPGGEPGVVDRSYDLAFARPRWPAEWERASQSYWGAVDYEAQTSPDVTPEAAQERRWVERTGVPPEETRLTISLPIHDEQDLLPSLLHCLTNLDIPISANVTTLFVTNGCSPDDRSTEIVENFMSGFGHVLELPLIEPGGLFQDNLPDPQIDPTYRVVHYGNSRLVHINTPTADKPNALRIADGVARGKDPVVINIDTDSFPGPDAIAHLYGAAYDAFVRNPGNTLVVYGAPVHPSRPTMFDLAERPGMQSHEPTVIRDLIPSGNDPVIKVKGYFHAWSPEIMDRVGGLPRVEPDDWVYDLVALRQGLQTVEAPQARVWIMPARTFEARRNILVRRFRGLTRMIEEYPELGDSVRQQFYLMRPPTERRAVIQSWIFRDNMDPGLLPHIEQLWNDIIAEGMQSSSAPQWHRIADSR